MMTRTGSLVFTLADIKSWATASSFQRGQQYYRDGAIKQPVKRGNTLESYCQGTYLYRVTIEIDDGELIHAYCTCPYDWGGLCKHQVTLLLTYLREPEAFTETETPQLADYTKEQLINLIKQMLDIYPDLYAVLERPQPGQQPSGTPVDLTALSSQFHSALEVYSWENQDHMARTIQGIKRVGDDFAAVDDWINASRVYRLLVREAVDNIEVLSYDETGYIMDAVFEAVSALDDCLDKLADDTEQRQAILQSLVNLMVSDALSYDYSSETPDIILRHARPEDVPLLRAPVEKSRDAIKDTPYKISRKTFYTDFLFQLGLLEETDIEILLQNLRGEGEYGILAAKLIDLARYDEAAEVIRNDIEPGVQAYYLGELAAAGQEDLALELAENLLQAAPEGNHNVLEWLLGRLERQGDLEAQFHWQQVAMQHAPSLSHYQQLQAVAQALEQWEAARSGTLERLHNNERYDLLVDIYLEEEAWRNAWHALDQLLATQTRNDRPAWVYHHHAQRKLRVATQAWPAAPERALSILREQAQKLVSQRGRKNYASAAGYLKIVREIYQSQDQAEVWQAFMRNFREEHARLPALQDELNKAGL